MSKIRDEDKKHVEHGGHDESTGKGPHTKAESRGGLRASVSGAGSTKAATAGHVEEHDSHERDHKMSKSGHEAMAGDKGSPSGTRRAQSAHMSDSKDEERGEHKGGVSGGRAIKKVDVDADHVIGLGASAANSAEGFADMASSKANRKEADEPEREMNEKAAMGQERSTPSKNTMGWGERETVGKHTI